MGISDRRFGSLKHPSFELDDYNYARSKTVLIATGAVTTSSSPLFDPGYPETWEHRSGANHKNGLVERVISAIRE
jgi:hypothetical protein